MESLERQAFRQAWARAIVSLRQNEPEDAVLERLAQAPKLKVRPDQLPWINDVRARLLRLLESLIGDASPKKLSRAARWISAFEEAGLHVDVWELQQFFWRWRSKILADGALALEREAALALGEKLRFSGAVLDAQDAAKA
jgi:hypothetical protein